MDAFEALISMLLRHEGYWTTPSFKIDLTKSEKRQIDKASSPRWELDLVAYRGKGNKVLAVECKSFLDSTGVVFRENGFEPQRRYKVFTDPTLREVVLNRLVAQLVETGACRASPVVQLCLAAGKIAAKTDRKALRQHFDENGWRLFDPQWIWERLASASKRGYENDIAFVVSKMLLRDKEALAKFCQTKTK